MFKFTSEDFEVGKTDAMEVNAFCFFCELLFLSCIFCALDSNVYLIVVLQETDFTKILHKVHIEKI